ncbi:MAG: carbohydrate ABC transporter permease [Anaerolineales bacterium]|nr:carbohydrate ABC transporter permease [Anaerolineales bacterium]
METAYRPSRIAKALPSILVTAFVTLLLILFLVPFLYMILTSLKTQAQFALQNAPIWPVAPPKYMAPDSLSGMFTVSVNKVGAFVDETIDLTAFAGQSLDVYTVPMEDGSEQDLALVKGFQKGSIFIDPDNPGAGAIVWNGGSYRSLQRPWVFSPAWGNFAEMWNAIDYPQVLWNTFFYAFTTTVGVLVSCILVAYGFSRFRFPFRDLLFMLLISIMFLPGTVTIIPTFLFFTQIGWVGTWLPMIVPSFFANPYDTFLLRQFFMTLPRELDESAMIDGASPMRVLWSIIIPQSYPVIVAVTVFHIVWAWNDYFTPLIYLSTKMDMQPVSVALARFNGMFGQRPELIQAGALVTLIPPLILFVAAQRFFVQGIVITGVEK